MTTLDTALTERTISKSELDYVMAWRELWADHVYWTRLVVEGIVDEVPGLEEANARLMKSCDQMADLMQPYYGNEGRRVFHELMGWHLKHAADLVTLFSQRKMQEAEAKELQWYANADDIARFLAEQNPNLSEKPVRAAMYEHLRVTKDDAIARLAGDYVRDIGRFDSILDTAYKLSDTISAAIIHQFPERFGVRVP